MNRKVVTHNNLGMNAKAAAAFLLMLIRSGITTTKARTMMRSSVIASTMPIALHRSIFETVSDLVPSPAAEEAKVHTMFEQDWPINPILSSFPQETTAPMIDPTHQSATMPTVASQMILCCLMLMLNSRRQSTITAHLVKNRVNNMNTSLVTYA